MSSGGEPGPPVLVVGGGGAIGREVARHLIAAGLAAEVADFSPAALDGTRTELGLAEDAAHVLDATDADQVSDLFRRLEERHGGLRALVNAQGIAGRGLVDDVSVGMWERVLAVNLTSVFLCCRSAVPLLRRVSGASIVNLASVAGLRPQPGSLVYGTSKAGVVMLTRTLAAELALDGVRVHAVCPTALDSPMVRDAMGDADLRAYAENQPMGRLLDAAEVARVVADLVLRPFPHTPEPFVV